MGCCWLTCRPSQTQSYLVAIAPEVVLGANVLVRVLGPLGAGVLVLLMGNVLPVGVPPDLGVDTGNDDAGNRDAVESQLARDLHPLLFASPNNPGWLARYIDLPQCPSHVPRSDLLQGQLAPELARLLAVGSNAGTLTVELVVLGADELLGGLGAVVAAAGAEGCAAKG